MPSDLSYPISTASLSAMSHDAWRGLEPKDEGVRQRELAMSRFKEVTQRGKGRLIAGSISVV